MTTRCSIWRWTARTRSTRSSARSRGWGAALLREKIVASAAKRFVLFGDQRKLVQRLGERTHVPVEVFAFGAAPAAGKLAALGCEPVLRQVDGTTVITDEGNIILDCHFGPIADPEAIAAGIRAIVGVVEHGLFLNIAQQAIVAGPDGVRVLTRGA